MKAKINHFSKFLVIILITIFLVTGIKSVFASNSNVQKLLEKAEIARLNGFYINAKDTLKEAKEILNQQPDSLQKAEVLRKLGNMLRLVGDIGKLENFENNKCQVKLNSKITSIQVLKESLDIASNIKDNNGEKWALFGLGNSARVLAEKYQSVNDEDKAKSFREITLDCYQKALDKSKNLDDDFTVRVQLNKFSFEINNQNISNFQNEIKEINDKITKLPLNNTKINARIDLAKSLIKIPESQEITTKFKAEILGKAIAESRQIKDEILESYAVGYLGNLYEQNQQDQEAINLTNKAIKLLMGKKDTLHIQYLWEWQLGRLYDKKSDRENAIAAYERSFDHLKYLKQDLVSLNPDVQYSFKEEVEPVYRGLVNLLLKDNPIQENLNKAIKDDSNQKNLKIAVDVMDKLQIAELNNFFRENCITAKPQNVTKNIDAKTALIYPIVFAEQKRIDVILSLPGEKLKHYSNPYYEDKEYKFEKIISDLPDELQINGNDKLPLSKELYPLIINPKMFEQLKNQQIKRLVFVLDTKLQNIPMSALYDGKKYLIEYFEIAVIPNLQLFKPKSSLTNRSNILIGGTSNTDKNNPYKEKFKEINSVKDESKSISDNFNNKEKLLEIDFNTNNIKSIFKNHNFSIIHFATHGQFSSDQEETFILTWDNKLNIKELKELIDQKQTENKPIELLVLSACETAKGDQRAALGLAGIAVRSGARTTLASLWNVDDKFTAKFMQKFYEELINPKNNSKSEALKNTQIYFRNGENPNNDENYQYPKYWGAFVLIGNWL